MPTIFSETLTIKASPQRVYDVLTDFSGYQHWNPWITGAQGQCVQGAKVSVNTKLYGFPASFNHKIIVLNPAKHFAWCDVGLFTYFAYGERHRFLTKLADGGCEYRVELRITGLANSLAAWIFGTFMKQGLRAEALALKRYLEAAK